MGPDSLGSVDTVPVMAASMSAGIHLVTANTAPAAPITRSRPAYARRRPTRSAHTPIASEAIAIPTSIAVNTAPTAPAESPLAARTAPIVTLPNPYRNARRPWIARISRRSRRCGSRPVIRSIIAASSDIIPPCTTEPGSR